MISLKQIHYALAVARTLHFKKAAEACSVSQSALSTALSEMERQLGFQIFERNNKKVLITPLGRQVLEKANQIKLLMDDLHKLREQYAEPLSASLRLGVIPTVGPYLLPIVLPVIKKQYPKLELHFSEEQSHSLLEQLRNGDLDAAILALPYPCDGLLSFTFWAEDFYWITHVKDKLASKKTLKNEELDPSRLMLLKEGHCLKDHALAACQLSDIAPHNLSATSLSTLTQLVASQMGTTLVPDIALAQLVNNDPRMAKVRLAEPGPHRKLAFIIRPNYPGLKNMELLMKLFQQALQNTCPVHA